MGDEQTRSRPGLFGRFLRGLGLGSVHPAVLQKYRRDDPDVDNPPLGGPDLVIHEANRVGLRASYAMENFGWYVRRAGDIYIQALFGVNAYVDVKIAATVHDLLTAEIAASSAVVRGATNATVVTGPTVARVLMRCRDEGLRITEKLAAQAIKDGTPLSPTAKGEFMDAVVKALARDAISKGLLPNTLKIAPAAASITGEASAFRWRVPDFWDAQTGVGYDVTTATTKQVVGHDLRYIYSPRNPLVMPDGTRLKDVMPLVYPPKNTPWVPGGGRSDPSLLRSRSPSPPQPVRRSILRTPTAPMVSPAQQILKRQISPMPIRTGFDKFGTITARRPWDQQDLATKRRNEPFSIPKRQEPTSLIDRSRPERLGRIPGSGSTGIDSGRWRNQPGGIKANMEFHDLNSQYWEKVGPHVYIPTARNPELIIRRERPGL